MNHGTIKNYIIGFVVSIALTLTSYYFVVTHINSGHLTYTHEFLMALILSLAVGQFVVQSYFFLHLGNEKGPRWNLVFYVATLMIILIVVLGSLWIMYHLNYNMMPQQAQDYIMSKEGISY